MTDLLRTYDRGVLCVTINRPAKRNALSRDAQRAWCNTSRREAAPSWSSSTSSPTR
jgi:hypothetical protein